MKKLVLIAILLNLLLPLTVATSWHTTAAAANTMYAFSDAGTITDSGGNTYIPVLPSSFQPITNTGDSRVDAAVNQLVGVSLLSNFESFKGTNSSSFGTLYFSSAPTSCSLSDPGMKQYLDTLATGAFLTAEFSLESGGTYFISAFGPIKIPGTGMSSTTLNNSFNENFLAATALANTIVTLPGSSTGTLYAWRKPEGETHCVLSNGAGAAVSKVHVTNPGSVGNQYYQWVDSGTLSSVAGTAPITYDQSTHTTNRFIASSAHDGETQCLDVVDVAPGDGSNATYYYRVSPSYAASNMSFDVNEIAIGFPPDYGVGGGERAISAPQVTDPLGNGGECEAFKYNIKLGHLENKSLKAGTGTIPTGVLAAADSNGPGGGAAAAPVCDIGSFSWLVCPAIDLANKGIKGAESLIQNILTFSPLSNTNSSNPLYAAWSAFRNLANVFFVLIFMIVIFGESIGIANYTVKKIMPRLVIAAIAIQFSWYLMGFLVDISNVAGAGVSSIVTFSPAISGGHDLSTPQKVLGGLFASGLAITGIVIVATSALLIPILLAIASIVIGIIVTFMTLELRILLIDMAIALSPVAIVAWVLPNTEKIAKRWFHFTLDLLLMYPIIMLLFVGGTLFSAIGTSAGSDAPQKFIAALGPIIAFLLVPATFKVAENALTKGGEFINKGGADHARKGLSGLGDRSAENRKQKALKKLGSQTEPPKGTLGRLRQRGLVQQAGFGFRTKAGLSNNATREGQLLAQIAKTEAAEQAGFERKFDGQQSAVLVAAAKDKSRSRSERTAAIAVLARSKDTTALNDILTTTFGGDTQADIYRNGVKGSFADLKAAAPHLVKPPAPGAPNNYVGLGADDVSKLDGAGHAAFAAAVASDTTGATAANAERVIRELHDRQAKTGTHGLSGTSLTKVNALIGTLNARPGATPLGTFV